MMSNADLSFNVSDGETYCFRDRFSAEVGACLLHFEADMSTKSRKGIRLSLCLDACGVKLQMERLSKSEAKVIYSVEKSYAQATCGAASARGGECIERKIAHVSPFSTVSALHTATSYQIRLRLLQFALDNGRGAKHEYATLHLTIIETCFRHEVITYRIRPRSIFHPSLQAPPPAMIAFMSNMARLLPTHMRPPLPNAQNHRPISLSWASFDVPPFSGDSQRAGFQVSGSGKTSGLRWRDHACAWTLTPAGRPVSSWPGAPRVADGGVTRALWISSTSLSSSRSILCHSLCSGRLISQEKKVRTMLEVSKPASVWSSISLAISTFCLSTSSTTDIFTSMKLVAMSFIKALRSCAYTFGQFCISAPALLGFWSSSGTSARVSSAALHMSRIIASISRFAGPTQEGTKSHCSPILLSNEVRRGNSCGQNWYLCLALKSSKNFFASAGWRKKSEPFPRPKMYEDTKTLPSQLGLSDGASIVHRRRLGVNVAEHPFPLRVRAMVWHSKHWHNAIPPA
ncbi:hypothetical protein KC315_g8 [Hortaea werneckii]|nr:hypothetical protein KC315_g8 [Hortaea werneckii]